MPELLLTTWVCFMSNLNTVLKAELKRSQSKSNSSLEYYQSECQVLEDVLGPPQQERPS